jgi:hypothetical protein
MGKGHAFERPIDHWQGRSGSRPASMLSPCLCLILARSLLMLATSSATASPSTFPDKPRLLSLHHDRLT